MFGAELLFQKRERTLVQGSGFGDTSPAVVQERQAVHRRRGFDGFGADVRFTDGEGPFVERFGRVVSFQDPVQVGQGAQTRGDERGVLSAGFLPNGEGSFVQRLRVVVRTAQAVDVREVVQRPGDGRVIAPELLFTDRKRPAVERLRIAVSPEDPVEVREGVQTFKQCRVLPADVLFRKPQRLFRRGRGRVVVARAAVLRYFQVEGAPFHIRLSGERRNGGQQQKRDRSDESRDDFHFPTLTLPACGPIHSCCGSIRLNLQDWNACAKNTTEFEIQEGGRVILSSLSGRAFRRNEIRLFPERTRYADSHQDKFQWKKLLD